MSVLHGNKNRERLQGTCEHPLSDCIISFISNVSKTTKILELNIELISKCCRLLVLLNSFSLVKVLKRDIRFYHLKLLNTVRSKIYKQSQSPV